jgi:carbon-monoxide dehydrogenase large subunit
MNLGTLAGVYRTPAIRAEVTAVFTHTNPVRPYRGNGRPEAAYVIERMVDQAAAELGIDPIELRRRNTIPPEAMPFKTGLIFYLRLRRIRQEPRPGAGCLPMSPGFRSAPH